MNFDILYGELWAMKSIVIRTIIKRKKQEKILPPPPFVCILYEFSFVQPFSVEPQPKSPIST